MATEQCEKTLPYISTRGLYPGKYKEWYPNIRPAGIDYDADESNVYKCMKPKNDRPESADIIRRFRGTFWPGPGNSRVFYGQAKDPQRAWAAQMRHGMKTNPCDNLADLVNPPLKSLFKQKLIDKREAIYNTHIRAPLGSIHDQRPHLPPRLDSRTFTFGMATYLDIPAGTIINPRKTYAEVEDDHWVGRDLYVKSHKDYEPGEIMSRHYKAPAFKKEYCFGNPTPHFNDGRIVQQNLKWKLREDSKVISQRLDEHREKYDYQLGKVRDPIKDTLKVPPDHTFGILCRPDEYGAGDLIHYRLPWLFLRGTDRERSIIASSRNNLKMMNFHKFHDLVQAFKFYDKEDTGKISIVDLRDACFQFNLPLEPELLEQVMDACDINKDGKIDYLEFSNFLNWKDKMPSGLDDLTDDERVNLLNTLVKERDHVQEYPKGRFSQPEKIRKQVDSAIGDHRTTYSMINGVVGGLNTKDFQTYGVPSIRTDLPAPIIKKVGDRNNYGDETDAYGLINPSTYTNLGVYEKDFLQPRSRDEIRDIFSKMGIQMTGVLFDEVWSRAAAKHPREHVSLESFRIVFDGVENFLNNSKPKEKVL